MGVEFIRDFAQKLERPYIINLSTGFEGGAKDGETDDLEYVLSNVLKGDTTGLLKAVVTAAGNSNYDSISVNDLRTTRLSLNAIVQLENRRCHARGHGPGSFRLNLTTTPVLGDDSCVLELWYSAVVPYRVGIVTPEQSVILSSGPGSQWIPVLSTLRYKFGLVEIADRGNIQGPGSEPPRWASTRIVLKDDTSGYGRLLGGTWTIELLGGQGTWDAYITATAPASCVKAVAREDISNECLIAVAGNVADAICVGAYNPCDTCQWIIADGKVNTLDEHLPGHAISHFSSRGPTRAGLDKPDIYAPGQCCVVALSQDMPKSAQREIDSCQLRTQDGRHYIVQGTSYAAPYVAGLIARMVQLRPCLSAPEIKHILVSSADHISDVGKLNFLVDCEQALKSTREKDCGE